MNMCQLAFTFRKVGFKAIRASNNQLSYPTLALAPQPIYLSKPDVSFSIVWNLNKSSSTPAGFGGSPAIPWGTKLHV